MDNNTISTNGALVLRIVLGGAPASGKTSTVEMLGKGLGQPTRILQFSTDDTPQHIDWMEYLGGRHDGKPIHTQLISVSSAGSTSVRSRMLQSADVVLFVVDTTPKGLAGAVIAMAELKRSMSEIDVEHPKIIVQANKRDVEGAVDLESLRGSLSVDQDVAIIETIATDGDGIRQAFIYSVRAGLERITRLGANRASAEPATPERVIEFLEASSATNGSPTNAASSAPSAESDEVKPAKEEPSADNTRAAKSQAPASQASASQAVEGEPEKSQASASEADKSQASASEADKSQVPPSQPSAIQAAEGQANKSHAKKGQSKKRQPKKSQAAKSQPKKSQAPTKRPASGKGPTVAKPQVKEPTSRATDPSTVDKTAPIEAASAPPAAAAQSGETDGFAIVQRTEVAKERRSQSAPAGGRDTGVSTAAARKKQQAAAAKKRRQKANQAENRSMDAARTVKESARRKNDQDKDNLDPADAGAPPPPDDTHRSTHQPPPPDPGSESPPEEQRPLNKLLSLIKGS